MQINLVEFAIFMLLRIGIKLAHIKNCKTKYKPKTILSQKLLSYNQLHNKPFVRLNFNFSIAHKSI